MSKTKTYGKVPFFTFYCTVLSRLAYLKNDRFLKVYLDIFGSEIPLSLLTDINKLNIKDIFKPDDKNYNLREPKVQSYVTTENSKNILDISKMAKAINIVFKDIEKKQIVPYDVRRPSDVKYNVGYISIATSNYGGYYIIVDTRMPNCIFVVFRGTYSAKAAGSYSKPSSITGHEIAKDISDTERKKMLKEADAKEFGVLLGINKLVDEVFNTMLEGMLYLKNKYLPNSNQIKIFTTGHSLGGAMSTLFAGNLTEALNSDHYTQRFATFVKVPCVVSIGSPRVYTPGLSNHMCKKKVLEELMMYMRVVNRGDPVPALPSKLRIGTATTGYDHTCSGKSVKEARKIVNMECSSTRKVTGQIDYTESLNCIDEKKTGTFGISWSSNPLAHTSYLYINFINAVNMKDAAKSGVPGTIPGTIVEIGRLKGDTVVRIIVGNSNITLGSETRSFKSVFFKLNDVRTKDKVVLKNMVKITNTQDTGMNKTEFDKLMDKLKPIDDVKNLNQVTNYKENIVELSGDTTVDIFDGIISPSAVQQSVVAQGGGKRINYKNKSKRKCKKKCKRKSKRYSKIKSNRHSKIKFNNKSKNKTKKERK
jgi:hypothetical protein